MNNQPQNRHYDIEMQTLQTLSQKLAGKEPRLGDYACNIYADKIAMIDIYLEVLDEREPKPVALIAALESTRTKLKIVGESLWIRNSDVLTNLGLKVGRTGVQKPRSGRNACP